MTSICCSIVLHYRLCRSSTNTTTNPTELLYRGTRHESMRECSPSCTASRGSILMWQNRERWQSAGLLLESAASIDDLANHLRSLLSVRLPSGDWCSAGSTTSLERALLRQPHAEELGAWLGPISGIWLTTEQSEWQVSPQTRLLSAELLTTRTGLRSVPSTSPIGNNRSDSASSSA